MKAMNAKVRLRLVPARSGSLRFVPARSAKFGASKTSATETKLFA